MYKVCDDMYFIFSPAHCAAAKGSLETLQMLVDNQANTWQKNKKGEYPVHEAALAKQTSKWIIKPQSTNYT